MIIKSHAFICCAKFLFKAVLNLRFDSLLDRRIFSDLVITETETNSYQSIG